MNIVCPWNEWKPCFEERCPYYKVVEALDSVMFGKCTRTEMRDDGK